MSELLTTGQMIDRLKVGEVAENGLGTKVFKDPLGRIIDKKIYAIVQADKQFLDQKWRILPNYVSFEEAMKALKEGKTIHCHPKWRNGAISHKITPEDAEIKAIKFLDINEEGLMTVIFESKWTIEEENNESK